jgi:CheY-like chemotaxis protein
MLEPSTAVPGRKKVVVVEDDPETRELELFLLGAEGYQVVGVPDGELAAETIAREAADLVILDLMLPGKDGIQVLAERSRSTSRSCSTPSRTSSDLRAELKGVDRWARERDGTTRRGPR